MRETTDMAWTDRSPARAGLLAGLVGVVVLAGCAGPTAPQFELDPQTYAIRGWYIGASRGVRVWVSALEWSRSESGRAVEAQIVLVNERATAIRFELADNELHLRGADPVVEERTRIVEIEPWETRQIHLRFRVPVSPREVRGGTLLIDGIRVPEGEPATFEVEFFRVGADGQRMAVRPPSAPGAVPTDTSG